MKDQKPRIVLDTNLFVASYFQERSHSRRLLDLAEAGRIAILWSEPVRREIERVLSKIRQAAPRAPLPGHDLDQLLLERYRVEDAPEVQASRDPADNKFLACALHGKADLIVSNDEHLLELTPYEGIPVVRPAEAFRRLRGAD